MSFFVWWPLLLLSCQIYVLQISESKNIKKKSKKTSIQGVFLSQARRLVYHFRYRFTGHTDQYTGNSDRLPVFIFSFSKIEFWTGFCDNRSNRWWPVSEPKPIFQSLITVMVTPKVFWCHFLPPKFCGWARYKSSHPFSLSFSPSLSLSSSLY
jgi:hypothetical protein